MASLVFTINGTSYADIVLKLSVTDNDLDADGSGRNILDGLMYRSRIATKTTIDVTLLDKISAARMKELHDDLYSGANYVTVKYLDPSTNASGTKTFYCSSLTYGEQYVPVWSVDDVYYDGGSFTLIER